jgi:hypothetical protein
MKNAPLYFARLGAISYIVWALLHFIAALSVYRLGQTMPGTMAQARVFQDAWNLACFSISAIGVALTMNWRNDGYGIGSTSRSSALPTSALLLSCSSRDTCRSGRAWQARYSGSSAYS